MDLVARVKGILLSPKSEWGVIDTESTTTSALYTSYIIPLAAIPAIAGFIGHAFIGVLGVKWGMTSALTTAVVGLVGALVSTFILALIIDALAPTFGGQKNSVQALKVAAYSSTAGWVAGIFAILPALGIIVLLGVLYNLYLLFLGLPIVMKAPQEKAMGYTVVVIVAAIVLYLVMGAIVLAVVGTGVMMGVRP